MARATFTILALALLCASAYADGQAADKISPAAGAAAGAIGGVIGPVVTTLTQGLVPADSAAGAKAVNETQCMHRNESDGAVL